MTEQVYRNNQGVVVSFPYESPATGQMIPSFSWLAGDENNDPADHNLTGPHDVIAKNEVEYDADTQKVISQDDGNWVAVNMTQEEIDERYEASIPRVITMRQARAALIITDNLQYIQPAIDAIEDPTEKALAQNEWDWSSTVERDRGIVQSIGLSLFTKEQLDQLFVLASQQA